MDYDSQLDHLTIYHSTAATSSHCGFSFRQCVISTCTPIESIPVRRLREVSNNARSISLTSGSDASGSTQHLPQSSSHTLSSGPPLTKRDGNKNNTNNFLFHKGRHDSPLARVCNKKEWNKEKKTVLNGSETKSPRLDQYSFTGLRDKKEEKTDSENYRTCTIYSDVNKSDISRLQSNDLNI